MNELVYLKNDEAVCSSLEVAERFGKRHDNVLKSIRGLLKNEDTKQMFKMYHYTESQNGQKYPMYLMNRDGFSILVMGFTGKKALDWKLQYIKAFNAMESIIKEKSTQEWINSRKTGKLTRQAETDIIKQLVEYAQAQGSEHAGMLYVTYSKLANKMAGITDRETATAMQLSELTFIENIILNRVRAGMEHQMPYKEIYKDCKRQIELFKDIACISAAAV